MEKTDHRFLVGTTVDEFARVFEILRVYIHGECLLRNIVPFYMFSLT